MSSHRTSLAVAAAASLMLVGAPALAAPGGLDATFGGDGRVTTEFAQASQGNAVALMGRKLLVAGNTTPSGARDWVLVRYRANGSLDPTFSHDGRARIDVGEDETLWDVVVLPSDKIVAVGEASGGLTVARLTERGRLDRGFGGGDGVFWSRLGRQHAAATCVGRLARGRLLVGGASGAAHSDDFTVVRLTADGRRDRSFGGDGVVVRAFGPVADSRVFEVHTSLADDSVLAIGNAYGGAPTGTDLALVQLAPSGRVARDFGGGDGKVRRSIGDSDTVTGAVDQSLGFTLVGGYTGTGGSADLFVARFNASGGLDGGWGGGDGVVVHDLGASEYWSHLAPAGGRTLVSGQVNGVAAVARLTASGGLDPTFGGGAVAVPFAQTTGSFAAVLRQPDGRVVAVGMAAATSGVHLAAARLLP